MYDVIVIGAGPAGMMAGISAAYNNKKVLIIERNSKAGKKLLLTGGSRCNLTNYKDANSFIKEIPVNGKMLYSTLNNFGPFDIYAFFESKGVKLKIEDNDRVFPVSNNAADILKALIDELELNKVQVKYSQKVINLKRDNDVYIVQTTSETHKALNVIIATGGLSYPKTGSDGAGYKLTNQRVTGLYPAETYIETKEVHGISGLTLNEATLKYQNKKYTGALLFTHKGITGPVVFKVSEFVYHDLKVNPIIEIDLVPSLSEGQIRIRIGEYDGKKEVKSFVKEFLVGKLADYVLKRSGVNPSKKIAEVSKQEINDLIKLFKYMTFTVTRTGSLNEALITGGGIDLKLIDTKTMESKINSNIFYAGEILDFHGHMGGYNLTIAFSTGYTAGKSCK